MTEEEIIDKLISTMENAVDEFNTSIPGIQKSIANEVEDLIRNLETKNGNIKVSVANIRKIAAFKAKILAIIRNSDYSDKVNEFLDAFETVSQLQNQYFEKVSSDFKPSKLLEEIKAQSISSTIESLTEGGLNENLVRPVMDILNKNSTTGGSISEMQQQLKDFINGSSEEQPVRPQNDFSKYVSDAKTDEELINDTKSKLRKLGFDVPDGYSTSNTDYGQSHYFTATDESGKSYKFRVSDHSFTSTERMATEFNITNDNIGKELLRVEKAAFPERFKDVTKTHEVKNKVRNVGEGALRADDKILSERLGRSGNKIYEVERTATQTVTVKERIPETKTVKTDGALVRHTKQITTDALNQYSGQYMDAVTNDLNLSWYVFVGSLIKTSRTMCKACLKKKYIHYSEFDKVIKGEFQEFKDLDGEIYDKTDLPQGMIEGTNSSNWVVYRNGYNCAHQLVPVSDAVVPQYLRDKFA